MVISSHVEGRVRIRDARLRDARLLEMLQNKLQGLQGVREVSGSAKAGSLLVLYRQAKLSLEKITEFLAGLLSPVQQPKEAAPAKAPAKRAVTRKLPDLPVPLNRRQAVNWGMLLSLLLSLGGLAVDSKRLHIIAGVVFVGMFGLHFIDKRKSLVA